MGAIADSTATDVASGGLMASRCERCEKTYWYARPICSSCMALTTRTALQPSGTVYSLTTVHRPPALFEGRAPYQVVLVDCDDGYRMLAMAETPLAIGARVSIRSRKVADLGEVPVAAEIV